MDKDEIRKLKSGELKTEVAAFRSIIPVDDATIFFSGSNLELIED